MTATSTPTTTIPKDTGMKIIHLTAENVKRLKAVSIDPDPTMQVVGGRNAQGKTSVLDAIWLALGGGKAAKGTSRPIRDGEKKATVTLDLGDLTVTRTWTPSGSQLRVESADGARYPSPQAILDRLVGGLSFDPLAFTRLPAREQRDALLDLVHLPVDVDALDRERAALYEQRTALGREAKALGDTPVDESLPVEEVSTPALLAALEEAQEHNRVRQDAATDVLTCQEGVQQAVREVKDLTARLADAKKDLADSGAALNRAEARLAALAPEQDTTSLREQIAEADERNRAIRANNEARSRAARVDRMREEYRHLTDQITGIDEVKATALADAEFPVDGLGFDADGVTYQGIPFSQASSAEQIRVSVAMAMALNPELRVLRIMDGSLLDEEAMAAIREQVASADFQCWVERVGDADEGAVVIEDGEVA